MNEISKIKTTNKTINNNITNNNLINNNNFINITNIGTENIHDLTKYEKKNICNSLKIKKSKFFLFLIYKDFIKKILFF